MTAAPQLRCVVVFVLLIGATVAFAGSLADPTRPYLPNRSSAGHVISEFSISAVLNSATRRVAIVNGVVVQAGGYVGDAKILEILPDGVRYERGGRQFTIRIAPLAAKVRVRDSTKAQTVKVESTDAVAHKDSP